MPGFLFLLITWGIWIISTFMMDKNEPLRLPVAVVSLLLIILHPVTLNFYTYHITASSILLLFIAYLSVAQARLLTKLYLFFSVMVIMFGYAGFYLLELYDPVWVLMDRKILLSGCLCIIGWALFPSSVIYRFSVITIGTLQGEVFLSVFLSKWKMPYTIGSVDYLDTLAITVAILLIVHAAGMFLAAVKKLIEGKGKERKQVVH